MATAAGATARGGAAALEPERTQPGQAIGTEQANAPVELDKLFRVKDKTVLVTGGGRGIGLMIAHGFVRNGARVFICSRDEKTVQAVSAALTKFGPGTCTGFSADLSSMDGVRAVATTLRDAHGITRLDVLVNNSGASWGERFEQFSEVGWDKVVDLNVKFVFFLTQALLPLLIAAGTEDSPARIINIGSIVGLHHQDVPTYSYDVSKAALHHLTRKLSYEFARKHVTVNAIAPGYVPSKMSKGLRLNAEKLRAIIPLGRVGRAADMAGAALYLASPAAAWVNGVILPVDGGQLAVSKM